MSGKVGAHTGKDICSMSVLKNRKSLSLEFRLKMGKEQ